MSTRLATATLVVAYSSPDDSKTIKAEIDREKHSGSTFRPGEQVFFRVYANCNYTFHLSDASSVTFTENGVAQINDETVQFVQSKTSNLQYPYNSNWSFTWWGKSYPIQTPSANSSQVGLLTTANEQTLVAIGRANYRSNYKQYRLNPASSQDGYAVVILILEIP